MTVIMARPRDKKIQLSDEQVKIVKKVLKSSKVCDTIKCRCRILLDLDMNHGKQPSYEQCAKNNGVCKGTVTNVVNMFTSEGLDAVLTIKRNINSDNSGLKVDGRAESRIIQLACGPAPEGRGRWTLRLLADRSKVVLEEPVGKDAIARVLKKTKSDPTKTSTGASHRKKTPNS